MANKADIIKLKEEHIQLAEIVKGVHKRLRRKYRTSKLTTVIHVKKSNAPCSRLS